MKPILLLLLLLNFCSANSQSNNSNDTLPRNIRFSPTQFYNEYDANAAPALRIRPGDTVITESLDARGFDKDSVRRGNRGNPLTGPFYVEGAAAGDVLAITITAISLNRNFATTLNAFIPKILPQPTAKQLWRKAKSARWNLDLVNNTASPAGDYEHLSSLKVPVHPFLGSVGVAPPGKSMSSGGFGVWGGNLDFAGITALSTLYLPVYHDGSLLYLGDGHALQGDGELNGDALETSMNFSFTVRVIKNEADKLIYTRVEDPNYIMAFGQAKKLDNALKAATQNLLGWVQQDYQLSIEEASQLIGAGVEYRIPKIAADVVEVVAMLHKKLVKQLKK
ncbi:MAG: acetamidase/formamidase family protein [Chitinophagaceae bacterium]